MSEELKVEMIKAIENYLNSCEEKDPLNHPLCAVQRSIEIRIRTNIEKRAKRQQEETKKKTYLDDDENLYD